jgi:hypothetical protein
MFHFEAFIGDPSTGLIYSRKYKIMKEENQIIEYIRKNIEYTSKASMCKILDIHRRTLDKIIRKNNIPDDRKYRYCPTCGNKIFHINSRERERSEGRKCIKCGAYDRNGENNPFFGKQHTDDMKKFYSEIHKGKRYSPDTEFKKGSLGNTTSNYENWIKKYGKEIADKKNEEFKSKISRIFSGEGNPMYGKPSPVGSGNGWSGWYKGWYFRSLLELSYMVFVIERFNLKWESGEAKKNSISYIYEGQKKNYLPDFIINEKYVIECKPKSLQNTKINLEKIKYAKIYCEERGLIMKIRDCRKINKSELIVLYKSGNIEFIEKYKSRMEDIINMDKNSLF